MPDRPIKRQWLAKSGRYDPKCGLEVDEAGVHCWLDHPAIGGNITWSHSKFLAGEGHDLVRTEFSEQILVQALQAAAEWRALDNQYGPGETH